MVPRSLAACGVFAAMTLFRIALLGAPSLGSCWSVFSSAAWSRSEDRIQRSWELYFCCPWFIGSALEAQPASSHYDSHTFANSLSWHPEWLLIWIFDQRQLGDCSVLTYFLDKWEKIIELKIVSWVRPKIRLSISVKEGAGLAVNTYEQRNCMVKVDFTRCSRKSNPTASTRGVANGPPTGAASSRTISDPGFSTTTKLAPIRRLWDQRYHLWQTLVPCAHIDTHLAALFENMPKHTKDSLHMNKNRFGEKASCPNVFATPGVDSRLWPRPPSRQGLFGCNSLVAGISRFAPHMLKVQHLMPLKISCCIGGQKYPNHPIQIGLPWFAWFG